MDKHPITPGEVLPVRELYGEMLLAEGRAAEAHDAFEAALARTPRPGSRHLTIVVDGVIEHRASCSVRKLTH